MICKCFIPCFGLSFLLSWWYLLKLKFLILMKSNLSVFPWFWWSPIYVSLLNCTFGVISKNALPNPRSWTFTPIFFSEKKLTLLRKTLLVLTLTFRSLIHFKLIFVNGVRNRFILKSARFSPTLFPHSVHTFSLLNADPEPPFLAFFFSPATLKIFSKYFSSIKPLDGFVLQHTFPPHREPWDLETGAGNRGVKRRHKPRGGFVGSCGSLFSFFFWSFHLTWTSLVSGTRFPACQVFWWWQVTNDCQRWPAHCRATHRTLTHVRNLPG